MDGDGDSSACARDRTRLLEAIVRASPDLLFAFDRAGRWVFASPAAAAALGRDPRDVVGRSCAEVGLPEQVAGPFGTRLAQALATGETVRGEARGLAVDGATRDFEYLLAPALDGAGAVEAVVCSVREIASRGDGDRALAARLQLAAEALAGARTRDEVADVVLGHALVALGASGASLRVVEGGEPRSLGSGDATSFFPLLAGGREVGELALSFAGERVLADGERELALALCRLCARALERTRPADDDAVDRLQREFLASLSSALRTPLAVVYGGVQTLVHRWPLLESEEQLAVVRAVGKHARELARLVDDLLAAAELASGTAALAREEVELAELLRLVATEEVSPQHELRLEVADDALLVEGDPRRLHRALEALVENAARRSGPGGTVTVSAGREGDEVVVAVADEGEPIPEPERGRLFERFRAAGDSGLGLGLYLARTTARHHGGELELAESGEGGSVFMLRLPAIG